MASDIEDGAGHNLVTAYAALRPDGQWSLLVVNKDQENPHKVRIVFHDAKQNMDTSYSGTVDMISFGSAQYQWHPSMSGGSADPDGPPSRSTITASPGAEFELPKASVTVLRGAVAAAGN